MDIIVNIRNKHLIYNPFTMMQLKNNDNNNNKKQKRRNGNDLLKIHGTSENPEKKVGSPTPGPIESF